MYTVEQARNLKKISQKEMAKLLGLSENGYINKEKGLSRFYIDEALCFSKCVQIPFSEIIFFKKSCHKKGTQTIKKGEHR